MTLALTADSIRPLEQHVLAGGAVALACSGGLDSVVLAHWFRQRFPGCRARLLHVHHGLQTEADQWQTTVGQWAQGWGYDYATAKVQVQRQGQGLEAAAREARYAQFTAWQRAGEWLLLAHHQQDQLETLLLRLMRGAGVSGLAGMRPLRPFGAGQLCRPFLSLSKAQLLAYAQQHQLSWLDDPSNADTQFDRNFIRQQVLPVLAERWPQYAQNWQRSQQNLADIADLTETRWQALLGHRLTADNGLKVVGWQELPAQDQYGVIRQWLQLWQLQLPSQQWLHTLCSDLIEARPDAAPRLTLTPDLDVRRYQSAIFMVPRLALPQLPAQLEQTPIDSNELGRLWLQPALGDGRSPVLKASALPCQLRLRQDQDQMRIARRQGLRSLKNILQEYREPPWWRERLPVLHHDGQIVALADLCVAEGFMADAGEPGVRVRWQRPYWPPVAQR